MTVTEKPKQSTAEPQPPENPLEAELAELRQRRPVAVSDRLRRFSAHNTAFARSRWDSTSVAYGRSGRSREEVVAADGTGYSQQDFALQAGAWTMAGHVRSASPETVDARYMETAEQRERTRYQPDDCSAFTGQVKRAARFLTELGWRAYPCGNDTALSILPGGADLRGPHTLQQSGRLQVVRRRGQVPGLLAGQRHLLFQLHPQLPLQQAPGLEARRRPHLHSSAVPPHRPGLRARG